MRRHLLISFLLTASLIPGLVLAQCELAPGMVHSLSILEGQFEVIVASDAASYLPDGVANFELIITNVSTDAADLMWPVNPGHSIWVTPVSCNDVEACSGDWVYNFPWFHMYFPTYLTLQPGECTTESFTWDLAVDPAPLGFYRVWAGLFSYTEDGLDEPFGHWLVPEYNAPGIFPGPGDILQIEVSDVVGAETISLGGLKASYR